MSLPYYEPTKYDYKTKEKGPPPVYDYTTKEKGPPPKNEARSELLLAPIFKQRDITFYTRLGGIVCFTSPDAAMKYKTFKEIKEKHANFKHVINLQQLGFGLPLMEAQFKLFLWCGETKFATIFKYVPPSPGSNRTFNKKTDKFKFCTVLKKREWHHTRYTFIIQPNQNNPSDTFTFSMFWHSKMPIIDVSPIRGSHRRYRWEITCPREYWSENYTYSLYWLEEKQKSTVDNMDVYNQKSDKTNSNTTSCVFQKDKIHEDKATDKIDKRLMLTRTCFDPQYKTKSKAVELTRNEGEKITMSTSQQSKKLLRVLQPQDVDLESIYSVGVHELAYTCMSCVINYIEECKRKGEKS